MGRALSETEIKAFRDDGFLTPFDVYSEDDAAVLGAKYAALEDAIGEAPPVQFRIKAHLPFPWLCDVIRQPGLLDAVEDLIGSDILCWGPRSSPREPTIFITCRGIPTALSTASSLRKP